MAAVEPPGVKIRQLREARGWSRAKLAAEVSFRGHPIEARYVRAIENGERAPEKLGLLMAFSQALGITLDALIGHPFPVGDDGRPSHPAMPAVQEALTFRAAWEPAPAELPDVEALRGRVHAAWELWQQPGPFSFAYVGALLPDLIRDAERAVRAHAGEPTRIASRRTAAELYLLVRAFVKWVGYRSLTPAIAERGLVYAEDVGDPALLGASAWNLAQAFTSTERASDARLLVTRTLDLVDGDLRRDDVAPELVSAAGALHLVSTIAAMRADDPHDAHRHLQLASEHAARLGADGNHFWLVFGPSNVAVHRVAAQVEAGRPELAAQGAQQVLPLIPRLGSVERQTSLLVDVAFTTTLNGGDDPHAVALLNQADALSRERLVDSAKARTAVQLLLRRATTSQRGAILPMARRLQVA